MKKQALLDLTSMPKMVLVIVMVVMLGTLFGATSYLLKTPKTDLPIVNPIIEIQCEIDSDCWLVYVNDYVCLPLDTSLENYKCLNSDEAKIFGGEKIDPNVLCSIPDVKFDKYICKCENGKCEKVKEELVEEISITTDKMEYEQGEVIDVIIKNNFSEKIFISNPIVEKKVNDNYVPLRGSIVFWFECGVTDGLMYIPFIPSKTVRYQWDQKEKWCSVDFSDRNVYLEKVLPGKYRIKSEIIMRTKNEKEDPNNISGKPSGEFIYSNEFTIKEKSALDVRCGEKVQLFGDCPAYFEEGGYYEFNSEAEKCIEKFIKGSGCNVKTPFKTLEECQEVCEEKIDTSDWQTYRNEEFGFEMKYPEDWKEITINENKDFLNKGMSVKFLFKDFPNRKKSGFVVPEGIDIRIYSKDYSCAPDEYGCAIFNCEENFEGETEYKRPADYGASDYLMMFCKRVGNNEFLPAAITYKYFIEENETNENIKNNITLQRIDEFKKLVDSFKFIEKEDTAD
ncbi:hypothetical protein KAI56_04260 [Candidatus Parcubacteria bacterium]|nr:hypothetical protein [Candidatus Parcubacteria bacterium]